MEAPDKEPTEITLEGRRFDVMSKRTLRHRLWFTRMLKQSGIVLDSALDLEAQLHDLVVSNEAAYHLLGGLLLPPGATPKDWTPEMAAETTAFLLNVADPADQLSIQVFAERFLVSFFTNGLAYAAASSTSSRRKGASSKSGAKKPVPSAMASVMASGLN